MNGDTTAQAQVRTILERYSGRAPDGHAPERTADGIYRHWIDPRTGGLDAGWDPEYATMSTMKIVLAAARAAAYYPQDASIQVSAHAESSAGCTGSWDAYFNTVNDAMYLKALGGRRPGLEFGRGSVS